MFHYWGFNIIRILAFLGFNESLFHEILKYTMIGLGIIVFISLFFVTAGYGRYLNKSWGPQIDNKLGWVIMEAVSPILFFVFYIISEQKTQIVAIAFLFIWEIHYIQRAFIYPFLIRGKKEIPITIILLGMVFNGLNSYIQARYLFHINPIYPESWLLTPFFIIGTVIWFCGFIINLHSDHILRNLRKPGETGYKIPLGGFFRWISCPNYFGEILEWIGWTILTWTVSGAVFALWTAANLIPRAISHHRWYHENFSEYPSDRKAIIPFVL
ncbi:DUF1295 domain-containing protein [Candidatus Harpocratesius sp.]